MAGRVLDGGDACLTCSRPTGETLRRPARAHESTGRVMTSWPSSRRGGRPVSWARSQSCLDNLSAGQTREIVRGDPGTQRAKCGSPRGLASDYVLVADAGIPGAGYDLLSIMTHEAGHFLGLRRACILRKTRGEGLDRRRLPTWYRRSSCGFRPPDRWCKCRRCRHGLGRSTPGDSALINAVYITSWAEVNARLANHRGSRLQRRRS